VAHTHTLCWQAHYHTSGTGHLHQGRFQAFPVEADDHFYTVVRYVKRHALRAGLVAQAQAWGWSSLWRYYCGVSGSRSLLSGWPLPRPRN
jgi:putative transposase